MSTSNSSPVYPELEEPKIPKGFHDKGFRLSYTCSPGTAVPICNIEVQPGDAPTYGFSGQLESFPMLAPCLDGFKYRVLSYFCNLSNYYGWIDNDSKISTSDFVNSTNYWSAVPVTVLPDVVSFAEYPTSTTTSLPAEGAWANPRLFPCLYNGVAPGSLLNALGYPVGYSGVYTDVNEFQQEANPSGVFNYGDFLAIRTNLHSVLAYMDAYRTSLVNLQERNCYYIGVDVVDPGYCYAESGEVIVLPPVSGVSNNRHFDYAYKPVDVSQLDAFMMFFRQYTSSPVYSIHTGALLSLDLSNPDALSNFVTYAVDYLLKSSGNSTFPGLPSECYRLMSPLLCFLEITGLIKAAGSLNPDLITRCYGSDEARVAAASFTAIAQNGGYFLTTFEMDLLRGVLSTNVGLTKSSVSTTGASFTIDAFRFANSVQKEIDRFDVSGGRISGWLRKLWNVKSDRFADKAQLLHVSSSVIGNTDIISTATELGYGEGSQLGRQAGYTIGKLNSEHDKFTASNYGVFIQIASLTPVVSYSQGLDPSMSRLNLHDSFMPQYANIGFQDVPMREFTLASVLPRTGSPDLEPDLINPGLVAARRPAWQDYRTSVDRSFGNFAVGAPLSYWTLPRYYSDVRIQDGNNPIKEGIVLQYVSGSLNTTTYVFPRRYNYLFAQTDDSAQNFRVSGYVTWKGTRNIPAPQMPSL